ncbi:MAG: hypothetical protein GW848_01370 [Rhodoferax sp.]|nr:hypothetical protein [Rhodoferax sp.]OIP21278.1 MAG: hypothetical protein AUK52_08880 [Comamonadaceae bacterium CG2_30_60_41]PIW10143.1 MAG: hypothetical protein COW39_01545 [Comamonadaceae bacterium CG17_big_fil_post_rev_8_21_14_2_50_60_13]PIY25972.1 MAG: hypothetical protein COZ10_03730 [Comamonadaceae bacterium CG_4_10_14_3_um_filter_60_75]PJC16047.1 MAG: hypothetical protein CO066_03245 [Comamonadaceae bacterium CG_4_9_14_0_8_um_filter_60_18]
MQSFYPEIFERDMACTEADWLRWLPNAIGDRFYKLQPASAGVRLGDGALGLKWQVAAPRVIGLVSLPRLLVNFRFAGVDEATRHAFMTRFDLYMQRGGG